MIKLIVGLGNPGRQYEETRHNAGFLFLDCLAAAHGFGWAHNSQFQGEMASLVVGGDKLVLLKPMTFMNRSGLSVGQVLRYYKFKPEEMLVIHDELELPEGVVKMKRDGGHAGHNGLRDIIAHIDSRDFYRLRIGIGRPVHGGVADYVLSRPSSAAFALFDEVFRLMRDNFGKLVAADVVAINEGLVR